MSERIDDDSDVAEYDTQEGQLERNPAEGGKWTSLAVALLGVWLIVSPWVFEIEFADAMGLNSLSVGVLLALLGGYNYYRRADEQAASVAVAAFTALLGLWLLASPWVYGLGVDDVAGWNYVAVGLVVAALGLVSSYKAGSRDVDTVAME